MNSKLQLHHSHLALTVTCTGTKLESKPNYKNKLLKLIAYKYVFIDS